MKEKTEHVELYRKHRPRKLSQVVGQEGPVRTLKSMLDKNKVPHFLLLTGPSGCGKTTIARILKKFLHCGDYDFFEVNCADFNGVDTVRDIRKLVNLAPISGDVKIWLIDEAHKLTGGAQEAFLKLLEDTPAHAYFIFATTDPAKLLPTVKTRASEIKLKLLTLADLAALVGSVCEAEGLSLSSDVMDALVEAAEGSARKALVLLGQVAGLEDEEERLTAVTVSAHAKDQAIQLARMLLNRSGWADVSKLLKALDEEAESLRYMVLGYARSVLLGGGKQAPRAADMIDCFARNFYDSKQAGLALACWEVVNRK